MADEPLPLATYARTLAHLISHRDQPIENVLGGLGLTMEQLQAADAHYTEQLSVAFRRRQGVLAMQFAQAFAEARRERGLFGTPAAQPAAPAPSSPEVPALPSYLNAPPAVVAPPPASSAPSSAPVAAHLPAPPPGFAAIQPPASREAALQSTADLPIQQILAAAVPFQPAAAPAAPASQSGPPSTRGSGPASAPGSTDAPRVGKLTLAHFAALTIEVGRDQADLPAILRRYGLSSADDLRYVYAAFNAQMSADPQLKARFEAMLARMRSMSRPGQGS